MRIFFAALLAVAVAFTFFFCATTNALQSYPPPPPSCSTRDSGQGGFNCLKDRPATINLETAAPVFVRSVKNGKKYLGGSGNDTFHVLHLYSETDSLYDMGFALGQLMKDEVSDMFTKIEPWLVQLLENAVPWLPQEIADIVVEYGAPVALDFVYDLVYKHIPQKYIEEWEGMAAGANCSIEQIKRVAIFPQVSKAACTAFSSVGPASANGGAHQLRALDFDPTSNVSDFATVIIYHYKSQPQLANFGYLSLTGCLTCMNYDGKGMIAAGEKKGGNRYNPFLKLPIGESWMEMFRDLLETYNNIPDINREIVHKSQILADGNENSIGVHLVFTDGKVPGTAFNQSQAAWNIGYNFSQQYFWDTPQNSLHPNKPGLVYFTKNSDPNTNCTEVMINQQYSNIDAKWLAMYYSPNDMTGDTQVVGMDTTNFKAYVANSRKNGASGPLCAYYRQRTLLDMKALFDETQ
jgi:hypothetical protein